MSDVFNRIADLSPQKRELLARLLHERGVDLSRLPIPRRSGDRSTAPLSFAQQRFWFLSQLEPDSAFYTVPTVVRLDGPLDTLAFERALTAVVERHEALRTTFPSVDGQPLQQITPARDIAMPVIEVAAHELLQPLIQTETQRPFDLVNGPLLRALLLRLAEHEHVLVLTMHHIVSDGWSMKLLIGELAACYHAFITGDEPRLAALPIQYADYADWQRQWTHGELIEQQLAYWKQQLAGLPTLNLPTDFPRPSVQSFRGARQLFVLPQAMRAALATLAHNEGVTMFMLLLAAYQTLLARYSRQHDIVVGSPIAGRHRIEIEALIGCFINTLVLRSDLAGDPPFQTLLKRVRQSCLQAYAHQDLPFEKLVEEIQPVRDLSRQPLFQAMFVFQDDPLASSELPRLRLHPLAIDSGTAQFDLTLSIVDSPEGLVATLEYNSDLFEPQTIARMAEHFQILVAGIIAEPARHLSALPLLPPREHQTLLKDWNATYTDYPADTTLHALVEQQVRRTPDVLAVVFDGGTPGNQAGELDGLGFTYAELDKRANQLAHHLQALGVGPEARVGVCMERSLELVVSLLGILKAGAAYLPLDPSYPGERLAFMLHNADAAALLVCQEQYVALATEPGIAREGLPPLVRLDADWPLIAEQPITPPVSTVCPDHPAYVIYTSGSTGKPKGVINTHRAIVNRLLWMQEAYGLTAEDRVMQKTPFSFDVSVWEFFWPLLSGARLVVARPNGHKDPAYLAALIAAQQISTLHFVPSMLRLFLDQPELARCQSLRRVVCSGEALPAELQQRFFARLDAELHNLYGPTEAAVDVTAWACQPGDTAPVPIGRPIANTQLYILDAAMQPVPLGVPGELHIGGVGLARGYLGQPALTAARFVPDPFGALPGHRLYKTGDLARYRPDGAIEFLGRLDQQVKIRGFRVEPGEIESVLRQHPAVREVAVVARADNGDTRLIAYIVPSAAAVPEMPSSVLRAFLHGKLPEYMIPSAFVLLETLPLSPNGKLDLRALPPIDAARPVAEAAYVAPQSALEQHLATIWQSLLRVDRVGVHDNFFDLGGHSLLLIQVHSRLRETLDTELAVVELFQYPTISALARHLVGAPTEASETQTSERAATRSDTMRQQRQFRQRSAPTKKPPRS